MREEFMTSDVKHCQATANWTIVVPANFNAIDNGDSWQSHADTRFVYVSSMMVTDGGSPVPATSLRATVARQLAPHSDAERHYCKGSGAEGDAQIISTATGFELKGFTCTDGCVATCVIAFEHGEDRDWAIATWQSLRPAAPGAQPNPWWRFW